MFGERQKFNQKQKLNLFQSVWIFLPYCYFPVCPKISSFLGFITKNHAKREKSFFTISSLDGDCDELTWFKSIHLHFDILMHFVSETIQRWLKYGEICGWCSSICRPKNALISNLLYSMSSYHCRIDVQSLRF